MFKRNKIALGIFAVFYISFGAYITVNQEKIIYQPGSQDFESCRGFADAEKISHKGTRMYKKAGDNGVVVLYHGNAGSACNRVFYAKLFERAGYGYIVPEYAGYSNDMRTPTHELIKGDVQNVVSYLGINDMQSVVVIGESIGTGMASFHTSLLAPEKLLLISPFSSLTDVAQRRFWFYPAFLLVENAFDNISLLSSYQGYVTIVHGEKDAIISQKSGLKLYEYLHTSKKEFVSVEGYGHNDLFSSPIPYEVIHKVLESNRE